MRSMSLIVRAFLMDKKQLVSRFQKSAVLVLMLLLFVKIISLKRSSHLVKLTNVNVTPTFKLVAAPSLTSYFKSKSKIVDPRSVSLPKIFLGVSRDQKLKPTLDFSNTINKNEFAFNLQNIQVKDDSKIGIFSFANARTYANFGRFSSDEISKNDGFSIFFVFKDLDGKSADFLSLGDCSMNRFLIGAPSSPKFFSFDLGSPDQKSIEVPLSDDYKGLHFIAIVKEKSSLDLFYNYKQFHFEKVQNQNSLKWDSKNFTLGHSECGNPFINRLGDFLFVNSAVNSELRNSLISYYQKKYLR